MLNRNFIQVHEIDSGDVVLRIGVEGDCFQTIDVDSITIPNEDLSVIIDALSEIYNSTKD